MSTAIFISGTPCVGKSTIASLLSFKLNACLIDVKKEAIENDLILGVDKDKGYKIVDIEGFDRYLQNRFKNDKLYIVESHLSHFFSNPNFVIILRVNPDVLEKRLASRNYSKAKIRENLESEALDICGAEAFELHGEKVSEIDATNLKPEEVVSIITEIISGENSYPIGDIDFMEWLITQ